MLFALPLRPSEAVRLPELRMPSEILMVCHDFVFASGDQMTISWSPKQSGYLTRMNFDM